MRLTRAALASAAAAGVTALTLGAAPSAAAYPGADGSNSGSCVPISGESSRMDVLNYYDSLGRSVYRITIRGDRTLPFYVAAREVWMNGVKTWSGDTTGTVTIYRYGASSTSYAWFKFVVHRGGALFNSTCQTGYI